MAIHIQNVAIESYRGLQNLQLDNLNHINIITGDNNSGKTSVLEVLSFIGNPESISTWLKTGRRSLGISSSFYNYFYNMFPVDEDEKKISFGLQDGEGKNSNITLVAEIEHTQISEQDMLKKNGLKLSRNEKKNLEDNMIETSCMHLVVKKDEEIIKQFEIFDFQRRLDVFLAKQSVNMNIVSISPTSHASGMLFLNDILADVELYTDMLNVLQEFDEDIISINSVNSDEYGRSSEYMILSRKHNRALPLNVYGDGMKKAILLLSAVIKAKEGILLLDEFETAIHTSAMDPVFAWILKTAKKLNVQLFLTSHSKEAIDKVMKCCPELQQEINLYTLYKQEEKHLVRCMNGEEAIQAQDELGLELR